MPEVSIIIPVYNAEPYLRRCLDSVLNQTLPDIEIICVDDGSADGSAAILNEYAAKDFRVKVVTQANAGAYAARIRALAAASGEWISFCDADDWIEPDAAAEMLEAARRDNADCVCCGIVRDGGNGRSVRKSFDASGPSDTYNALVNKLFRRELLDDIKADETVVHGEDLMVSAQALAKAEKITVLDRAFYHYCENAASVTHVRDGRRRVRDLARVGEILREALPGPAYADFHDRVARDALLLWIRYRLFDIKLWRSLRSRMRGALSADPRHGIIKKGALTLAGIIFD